MFKKLFLWVFITPFLATTLGILLLKYTGDNWFGVLVVGHIIGLAILISIAYEKYRNITSKFISTSLVITAIYILIAIISYPIVLGLLFVFTYPV